MAFRAWTDYPFKDLGDAPGKPTPIRRVTVLEFDGDKYVNCLVDGCDRKQNFKRFYCYKTRACDKTWSHRKFANLPPVDIYAGDATCA